MREGKVMAMNLTKGKSQSDDIISQRYDDNMVVTL
jgi:hypothetical protein